MKSKIIYNLVLIWTIFSGSVIYAQNITGNVADANGPLPGVNIVVKGTAVNATTDFDGNFSIASMSSNATLVFSYIGYLTKEAPATSNMKVVLVADSQNLDEVIVTGYVGQRKSSISGAVTQVDMEDLAKTRVPDVTQALQGQVAGVFVTAATGAPGDGIRLRIRGQGSLNNNDALYIVDGVPTRDIGFINASDVKSITVLKDAASASVYGSRSAGGVVVITTKKGSSGKSTIDIEAFTGVHFAQNLPKMLNKDQYLSVKDQAWHNSAGNAATAESPYAFDRRTRTDLADTDWQKELFTTGLSNNIQLSTSGGSDNVQYLVSGGYYGIDGIVTEDNDRYKRVNFRTNINANVTDRFSVGTNVQLNYIKQDRLSSSGDAPGVIRHALIRPPVIGVYKDPSDPTWSANDPYTDLPFYTGPDQSAGGYSRNYEYSSNPMAIVHFTDDTRGNFQTFGNVYAEYAFLKDKSLKFKTNLGADLKFLHNKTFAENYGDPNITNTADVYYGLGRNNRPNSLNESRGETTTFTWSNTLNYVKTFKEDHSLNILLGTEFIRYKESAIGGARSNFDNTSDLFRYLDYGSVGSPTTPYPYSSGTDKRSSLFSYFASATYGFKNRYFVTGTMRADASSRFDPKDQWAYFPSASANWIVSNENFMKNVNWLSNLKLRASWGKNGNQEVPDDAFRDFVSVSEYGTDVIRYASPKFRWESTTQTNFGIDLSLIKNKLSFSVDYFKKETTGILLPVRLPGVSVGQIESSYINAGEVKNTGFEYYLNFQNNDHAFKYGITANLATLDNEVEQMFKTVKYIDDAEPGSHTRTAVGTPINAYFGYEFIGIYQNQAEVDSYLFSNANGRVPGDMKFKDVNGDGQIDANDRTFIGNPIPKMTYGLAFNASFKNFDLSFLFQGVEDVDRYNDLKQILDYDTRPFNSTTGVLDSWHGEGTSNTRPRLTFNSNGGQEVSSAFVEDASYLRLKNIEIGYTFGKSLMGISNLRIYLSGQNLLTWTDYSGLDPESTNLKDQGTYPQAAAVIFGARIKI